MSYLLVLSFGSLATLAFLSSFLSLPFYAGLLEELPAAQFGKYSFLLHSFVEASQ